MARICLLLAITTCIVFAGSVPASGQTDPGRGSGGAGPGESHVSANAISALFEDPVFLAAMEQARAQQARLLEERLSDEGAEARAESATAYQDQSAQEAEATAREEQPAAVEEPIDPLALPPGADVERYLSGYAARVDLPSAGDALIESTVPLRAKTEAGRLAPTDYSLNATAGGLEAENPLATIHAFEEVTSGLVLPDINVAIAPSGTLGDAAPVREAGGTAFYANAYPDTDFLVRPELGGAEVSYQLRSADSPEAFALDVDLPPGAQVTLKGNDLAIVDEQGKQLALLTAPVASDAEGWEIPLSYHVAGDQLRIEIEHRGGDWAYPLVLDPAIVENQRYWHYWDGVDFTGWGAYASPPSDPFQNTLWQTHDYWGRGLYTDGFSWGSYGAYDNAAWFFHAPGPASYIFEADMDLVRNNVSDFWGYAQTHLMTGTSDIRGGGDWGGVGLWDSGASWEDGVGWGPSPLITSVDKSWRNIGHYISNPQRGNTVLFMTFMGGEYPGTPWESFTSYFGGAQTYIGDDELPQNGSPEHKRNGSPWDPSAWISGGNLSVVAQAEDLGLGIKEFKLSIPGQPDRVRPHACSGDRFDRCPILEWIRSDGPRMSGDPFAYSADSLPEGRTTAEVKAKDFVGNWSSPQSWTVKVDRSKPALNVSGELWDAAQQGRPVDGTYSLRATATDQYSGAAYVEVQVDGEELDSLDQPCDESGGCTRQFDVDFQTDWFTEGQHTVTVLARDQVGNQADPISFTIKIGDGPTRLACTGQAESGNFPYYSLGPLFETQVATNVVRRCDAPGPDEDVRANFVSYLYGTCTSLPLASGPAAPSDCAPPIEIQSWPSCERSLADYQLDIGVPYPSTRLSDRRGVPVYSFDGGTRVELYAGNVTIVLFGDDPAQVLRAVNAIRAEPPNSAPGYPPTGTASGGNLPAPAAGSLEGTLPCDPSSYPELPREYGPDPAAGIDRPAIPFSSGGVSCAGPRRSPVTVVFIDDMENHVAGKTGWATTSSSGTTNGLRIGNDCVLPSAEYRSTSSATDRYYTPVWTQPGASNPGMSFGSASHQSLRACGWAVDPAQPSSGPDGGVPGGYDLGRRELTNRFAPNPVGTVYWGNSRSTIQCSQISGNSGNVAVYRTINQFGYNEDWFDRGVDPAPDRAYNGGARIVRIPLNWDQIQSSIPGTCTPDTQATWDQHWDQTVTSLIDRLTRADRPLDYIFSIGAAPCWAFDNNDGTTERCQPDDPNDPLSTYVPPDPPSSPTDPGGYDDWYQFVREVVRRYPDAAGIEIWNEPNNGDFWGGCDPQPERYGDLLLLADQAVEDEQPVVEAQVPIILAGMSPKYQDRTVSHQYDWQDFLISMRNYVLPQIPQGEDLPWDIIGLHPYRRKLDVQGHQRERSFGRSAQDQVVLARQILGTTEPIWITEVGASTEKARKEPNDPVWVRRQKYATTLKRIYNALNPMVPTLIIHRLINLPAGTQDQPKREQGSGVLRSDLTCRDAYFQLAELRGATPPSC